MIGPHLLTYLLDNITLAMAELPPHSRARTGLQQVREELLRIAVLPPTVTATHQGERA